MTVTTKSEKPGRFYTNGTLTVEKCKEIAIKYKIAQGMEEKVFEALIDDPSAEEPVVKFDLLQRFCDFFTYIPFLARPEKNKSSIEVISNFSTTLQTDIRDSLS